MSNWLLERSTALLDRGETRRGFLTKTALVGTALAVGLWASALNVRYRDVRHVMPFVIQLWLLASPVAYSASLISSPVWQTVYGLNPMAGVIQGFRWALLGSAPPTRVMVPSVLATAVLLAGGLFFFKRTEASFADVI